MDVSRGVRTVLDHLPFSRGAVHPPKQQPGGDGSRRSFISRPWLVASGVAVGFIAVVTVQLEPPYTESRFEDSQPLVGLIQERQREVRDAQQEQEQLRAQLQAERDSGNAQQEGLTERNAALTDISRRAGMVEMRGTGFTVTLADSSLSSSPTGNVNDLVIHSQDVQAVVNAMWANGAEAIAINGERVVSTSAILCVGNTLLLNGTVHAPPYEITAIGANRDATLNDPLVRRLADAAREFSLRYDVSRNSTVTVPGYSGSVTPRYAQVAT